MSSKNRNGWFKHHQPHCLEHLDWRKGRLPGNSSCFREQSRVKRGSCIPETLCNWFQVKRKQVYLSLRNQCEDKACCMCMCRAKRVYERRILLRDRACKNICRWEGRDKQVNLNVPSGNCWGATLFSLKQRSSSLTISYCGTLPYMGDNFQHMLECPYCEAGSIHFRLRRPSTAEENSKNCCFAVLKRHTKVELAGSPAVPDVLSYSLLSDLVQTLENRVRAPAPISSKDAELLLYLSREQEDVWGLWGRNKASVALRYKAACFQQLLISTLFCL